MKQSRIIKMRINETYIIVRIDRSLSDAFPIENILKRGDVLSSLLCNFTICRQECPTESLRCVTEWKI
jgi:hypothetical protein